MKIALESQLSYLADRLGEIPQVEVIILPEPNQIEGSIAVDGLLGTAVGNEKLPKIIEYCQGLKWVHILGTGVDTYPLDLIQNKLVTCSRGATATPISEWVLAMMLAYEKQLPDRWITKPPEAWYMADLGCLKNKTLGVVGFGAIGQAVAKKALAFDMKVIAKVRNHRDSPYPNVIFERDIENLLSQSDHVVLALPSTPQSHHLINTRTLGLMKPGVHLVNVSRSELIEQVALRQHLNEGQLGRASLDVVKPEPLPFDHWMYSHPRVKLSPHIAWNSPTSHEQIIAPFIENVRAFVNGEPLSGIVDTQAGY